MAESESPGKSQAVSRTSLSRKDNEETENDVFQRTQSSLHSMLLTLYQYPTRRRDRSCLLYYNEHYQPNPSIPTSTLGDLMKLILKENLFHFNGKHFLQTHDIAMGTKTAVAFSVIFMAHIEKQLLLSGPHKPLIRKRFIEDGFSVWTSSKQEISNIVDCANRFHATIKFRCEMSS